jgi:hypothetical protein
MTATELLEPILTGGIANTNFFNGRLLTAEDLRTEQAANRAQHEQLAHAIGEGVAYGLEVRLADAMASPPTAPAVVRVTKGLALNRNGDAVALTADTEVALVAATTAQATTAGLFAECQPPQAVLTNLGLYILTIMPASGFQGRAPMTELGGGAGIGTGCGSRNVVEGVKFRLLQFGAATAATGTTLRGQVGALATQIDNDLVQLAGLTGTTADGMKLQVAEELSRLRNMAAHLCFGTDSFADFTTNPFPRSDGTIPGAQFGALDDLRARQLLSDCEVPLALLYWGRRGVEFVDWWAVRRPVFGIAASPIWTRILSARRAAESMAMLLQFQQHVEDLRTAAPSQGAVAAIRGGDYFRYLPPCGFLPVLGVGAGPAFDTSTFFTGHVLSFATEIAGSQLAALVNDALMYGPFDLTTPSLPLLYTVRENALTASTATPAPPYVVFASRDVEGIVERDDVARTFQDTWDAYRGLVKRRTFLPPDNTADAAAARIAITTAVQAVMSVASQKATLAAARHLPSRAALDAFMDLYAIQHELVLLFQTALPGVPDMGRSAFAGDLNGFLETAIPGGDTGLLPAITLRDLKSAVIAQNAINFDVGSLTGEGVAIGFLQVLYDGNSPRGKHLVPGDIDWFRHGFMVSNSTDKTLTINLIASFLAPAPRGSPWQLEVHKPNASPPGTYSQITSVTLASGANTEVFAAVRVPANAQTGDSASLQLTASVPAPHNKTASDRVDLVVDPTVGTGGTRSVSSLMMIPDPTPGSADLAHLNALGSSENVPFEWDNRFGAPEATGEFDFSIVLFNESPAGSLGDWDVQVAGYAVDRTVTGTFKVHLTLNSNDLNPLTRRLDAVVIAAPQGAQDKSVSLKAHIVSTNLPETIAADSATVPMRVPHS